MQTHTTLGAEYLVSIPELHQVIPIVRNHHERWDGTGYPDRLSAEAIPLAARLLAVCDVYDALRARRVYKPGMTHAEAVAVMTEGSPGHFDPGLLTAFAACADRFDRVFREVGE